MAVAAAVAGGGCRYAKPQKRDKLPKWIKGSFDDAHLGLSTDMAVAAAQKFLREKAQPVPLGEALGVSLLDEAMANGGSTTAGRRRAVDVEGDDGAVRAAEFDSHDAETREQLLRVALDEVEAQWVAERRGAAEERGRCEAFEARLLLAEVRAPGAGRRG